MANLSISRLWKPDHLHRSRFHDMKGNRVPWNGLVDLPMSFTTTILRHAFGYRPAVPWIPYPFIRQFEKYIGPDSRVIEFGSGMSTIWLSHRCGFLVSRENDELWYTKVSGLLDSNFVKDRKIQYQFKTGADYLDLSEFPNQFFDFCIVDGFEREKCIDAVLPKMKNGGHIYLDNTDDAANASAERRLKDVLLKRARQCRYITGFIPTYFQVTQGVLWDL